MVRLLIAFAVVGFLVGYATGNFSLLVYINAVGLAVTLALVVPDWPFFRRHPLNWLPPLRPGSPPAASAGGVTPVAKPPGKRRA